MQQLGGLARVVIFITTPVQQLAVQAHTICPITAAVDLAALRRAMCCAVCCVSCKHRYGVAIGSTLAPLVRVLMLLCAPITWPLGKLLDLVLGHENVAMKRQQLKAMVQLHGEGAGEVEQLQGFVACE